MRVLQQNSQGQQQKNLSPNWLVVGPGDICQLRAQSMMRLHLRIDVAPLIRNVYIRNIKRETPVGIAIYDAALKMVFGLRLLGTEGPVDRQPTTTMISSDL
jgi:hypothetical protein